VFVSDAKVEAKENTVDVMTVRATDQDSKTVTYSIAGGADKDLFKIDSKTGVMAFNSPQDFEVPADAGQNGVYDAVVQASDGMNSTKQEIAVTVTDVGENTRAPELAIPHTIEVKENTLDVVIVKARDKDSTTLTFAIVDGADKDLFKIGALTA
jgi:hypothetical protein